MASSPSLLNSYASLLYNRRLSTYSINILQMELVSCIHNYINYLTARISSVDKTHLRMESAKCLYLYTIADEYYCTYVSWVWYSSAWHACFWQCK